VVFRFEGGPFTFVFREVPTDFADALSNITATFDGQPLPAGERPGQVEIERGNPTKITWHFAPTSDASHTFGLTYQVMGVVRQEADADRFVWNALPTDYEYRIAQSSVRLTYPASLTAAGAAEVQRGRATVSQDAGVITFTSADLRPNTPLTVAVNFPRGSLIASPPRWQVRNQVARANLPGFGFGALAVLVIGLIWLVSLWRKGRRQDIEPSTAASITSTPPSDLSPAGAGALKAGGAPSATHALGALFGLAQRGVLVIEESSEKRWYKTQQFVVRLVNANAPLRPHEDGLLEALFTEKGQRVDMVKFSDLSARLATKVKRFNTPLTEELEQSGFLDPARRAYARQFMFIGIGLMLAMVVLIIVAALIVSRYGPAPFLLAAASFIVSLVAFILSAAYSQLSDAGAREAVRWQGFEQYLKEVGKGKETAWDMALFDRYFPYAAAFGLAEGWAKAYQKRGGTAAPAWFYALPASGDASFASFIVMTSAAHSSGSSGGGGAGSGGAVVGVQRARLGTSRGGPFIGGAPSRSLHARVQRRGLGRVFPAPSAEV
jgi:uncharacterized protein (TIGR04222 family)